MLDHLPRGTVEHSIVSNSSETRRGVSRITFLKNVRNKVMEPLYLKKPKNYFSHVLFFNDILFCQQDVMRLLLYNADMACALDFDYGFRDTWVGFTIDGRNMFKQAPFTNHTHSAHMVSQGRAFHAFSCWNGLVVINPKGFYEGIRFHDGSLTKCPTSECTLFSVDMWLHGLGKIVIDPVVRVAYEKNLYEHVNSASYITTPINTLVVNKDIQYFPPPDNFVCCPLNGFGKSKRCWNQTWVDIYRKDPVTRKMLQ